MISVGDWVVPNPEAFQKSRGDTVRTPPGNFYLWQGPVLAISDDGEHCDIMSLEKGWDHIIYGVQTKYLMVKP